MRCFLASLLVLLALSPTLPGCSSGEQEAAAPAEQASQLASGHFTGTVAETMDAGGYTYARLSAGGEEVWAAGPVTALSVGQEVTIDLAMLMQDFHSESLGRDFDRIYFVGTFEHPDAGAAAHGGGTPPAGMPAHPAPDVSVTDQDLTGIEVAEGGLTVADLWARRGEMAGQTAVVRGRVVKYNAGIMDRNWIHLQDGSGDAGSGTHDLTVTTTQSASVGDLLTVRGTVVVDKDFGSGYRYGLLLEDAQIDTP